MIKQLICVIGLAAANASAATVYFSTQGGSGCATAIECQLGVLNTTTGAVSGLVNTRDDGSGGSLNARLEFYDIAVNALSEIYGVDSGGRLWKVNGTTGYATLIAGTLSGPLPSTRNGLAFGDDGFLYLSGSTGTIVKTNVSTCSAGTCTFTAANSTALPSPSGGDIAFLNGKLYMAAVNDRIYELVLSAGNWVLNRTGTGNYPSPYSDLVFKGLAVNNGILYASFHGFGGATNAFSAVNLADLSLGAPTSVTLSTGSFFAGMGSHYNAVPEPSTVILLLSALGAGAFVQRRRAAANKMA